MYQPSHFRVEDRDALHALIEAYPLATLVVPSPDGLEVNHLPLMFDASRRLLVGHVARANPVWQIETGSDAIAVFHGPQAYVTPHWYPSKREHGKVVPTWNYAVVHAHGRPRWITADTADGEAWLHALLNRLTDTQESVHGTLLQTRGHHAPTAWQVDDAPADYVASMRRAIVGLEFEVTRLEGKFKLSQNRTPADLEGVLDGLTARGDADSALLATVHRPAR